MKFSMMWSIDLRPRLHESRCAPWLYMESLSLHPIWLSMSTLGDFPRGFGVFHHILPRLAFMLLLLSMMWSWWFRLSMMCPMTLHEPYDVFISPMISHADFHDSNFDDSSFHDIPWCWYDIPWFHESPFHDFLSMTTISSHDLHSLFITCSC